MWPVVVQLAEADERDHLSSERLGKNLYYISLLCFFWFRKIDFRSASSSATSQIPVDNSFLFIYIFLHQRTSTSRLLPPPFTALGSHPSVQHGFRQTADGRKKRLFGSTSTW